MTYKGLYNIKCAHDEALKSYKMTEEITEVDEKALSSHVKHLAYNLYGTRRVLQEAPSLQKHSCVHLIRYDILLGSNICILISVRFVLIHTSVL